MLEISQENIRIIQDGVTLWPRKVLFNAEVIICSVLTFWLEDKALELHIFYAVEIIILLYYVCVEILILATNEAQYEQLKVACSVRGNRNILLE